MYDPLEATFLLWPWKTLTSHFTNSLYFTQNTRNAILLLFLSVSVILLRYVALFWRSLASSKPMSTISLCMGCCQVVCLSEHPWPRLGAWLSPLRVTINLIQLMSSHGILSTTSILCSFGQKDRFSCLAYMMCLIYYVIWKLRTSDLTNNWHVRNNERTV